MNESREVFDLLTSSFEEQQKAYSDIEELFGSTGEIQGVIDSTMAKLEQAIMLSLGWYKETVTADGVADGTESWVKDDMRINADVISEWFSIFRLAFGFEERMDILFNMSMGDEEAISLFNCLAYEDEENIEIRFI